MLYKLDAGFGVAKEEHIFAWWTETHRGKTSPQGQCPICLLPLGSPMPSLIRENDKGGRCRGLTSVSHNFFHSDSSFTIGRYIGYRIVGVCTLCWQVTVPGRGKNAEENQSTNAYQVPAAWSRTLPNCLPKDAGPERGLQILYAAFGFKT